jgi:predicted transcriptional regulator
MAKKKNNLLNKFERDILLLFNRSYKPLTINEIASKLDISYMTAQKYVRTLLKKKLIIKK